MSLNKVFKSLSAFTAVAVFAFSIAVVPATSAAPSGGVSAPSANDNTEGKCAHASSPADKSSCLKGLISQQREQCKQFKAKKEAAKAKTCVETVNKQIERLKNTQARLAEQKEVAKKVVVPKDYQQCLTRVAPIDDTSNMQGKINKSIKNRQSAIAKLQKRVDSFTNEGAKSAMTSALASDKAVLDFYQAASAKTDSPSALQSMYCQSIFRLQINNFRNTQVKMLKNVDSQLNFEQARHALFTNPVNQSDYPSLASNSLKSEVTSRLDTARQMTQANLSAVATAYMQTAGTKVTQVGEGTAMNYTTDLSTPKTTLAQAMKDRATAMRNYDEAQVLRKTGSTLNNDRSYTVSSITLKNSKGSVINADGSVALNDKVLEACKYKVDGADNPNKPATAQKATAKELKDCREKLKKNTQPREAVVVVKSGNKDYTKKLSRPDKVTIWKVRN